MHLNDFYVRIGFSYKLVAEKWEQGIFLPEKLLQAISRFSYIRIRDDNLSFAVIKVSSTTSTLVEEEIRRAWSTVYPGEEGALSIMMTSADGSQAAETMRIIYSNYYGVESYQRLCTDLAAVVPTLKSNGGLKNLRHQNYLFVMDSGCGFSTLLASFSDFIDKLGIFEKEQEQTREYIIGPETKEGHWSEDDIVDALYDDNVNYTAVAMDISYFLDENRQENLRTFLNRLYKKQGQFAFIFHVPFMEESSLKRIRGILNDVLNVKEVIVPPMQDIVLLEYLYNEISGYGYRLDDGIPDQFIKQLYLERKDGRIYGFKTANKILNEMLWEKAVSDAVIKANGYDPDKSLITKEDMGGLFGAPISEKSGYDELNELIGMEKIAERVREIAAQVRFSMQNESLDKPSIHMRFVGAPGTGKTTVARIIGKIFKEEGILRKGAFFEVEARSLCGEYIGQTAPRTAAICRNAYGSVLFIDEAYSLYTKDASGNDYGKEALATLIAEMENHRDDMLVIMAGYTDEMNTLMEGNVGLRSRMPYMIEFENYTREQLADIFMMMARKSFVCADDLEPAVREFFSGISDATLESKEFSNARYVRNLYERTWSKAALRASLEGAGQAVLTANDLQLASMEEEFNEDLIKETHIGF